MRGIGLGALDVTVRPVLHGGRVSSQAGECDGEKVGCCPLHNKHALHKEKKNRKRDRRQSRIRLNRPDPPRDGFTLQLQLPKAAS